MPSLHSNQWGAISPAVMGELRDDDTYVVTCDNGHVTTAYLQANRFEVLFDLGMYAILDGYYREAVANFASALEGFYGWFIDVVCTSCAFDYDKRQKIWKNVANQSERQFGAFYYLWTIQFKEEPRILLENDVRFRNIVIHKGALPSRNDAIDFGQRILEIIYPQLSMVKETYSDAVQATAIQRMARATAKYSTNVATIAIWTSISTVNSMSTTIPPDVRKLLDVVKISKRLFSEFPSASKNSQT